MGIVFDVVEADEFSFWEGMGIFGCGARAWIEDVSRLRKVRGLKVGHRVLLLLLRGMDDDVKVCVMVLFEYRLGWRLLEISIETKRRSGE